MVPVARWMPGSPSDLIRGPGMTHHGKRTLPILAWIFVFLICLTAFAHAADPQFPPLTGRVIDQAGILSPAAKSKLTELLEEHERRTSNQVVVLTVNSLQGYDIADYGVRLGRAWQLGQRGRNNGAILIVAPRERLVRIEVGYGLEGDLPDARASAIIQQEIIPRFRAGDFEGGIVQGTIAILGSIEGTYKGPAPSRGQPVDESMIPILMIIVFFVVIALFNGYGGRRRSGWGAPIFLPGPGGGWGGGRRGGGGFSGGGGSFGGGGASGRW